MYWEARREAGATYSSMNIHALFQLATIAMNLNTVPSLWMWVDPSGSGNGSVRNALDYLLPYATNASAVWPWHQDGIATPWSQFPWVSLAPQMRIASLVYRNATYEAMIPLLPWKDNGTNLWAEDATQLLWPNPPL